MAGNPVIRRLGFGVKRLRGIRREGGPAAVAPDQFWDATNVIPVGGELIPRNGQARLNAALLPNVPATEFFNGMFDEAVGGSSVGGCGGGGGVEQNPLSPEGGGDDGPKLYHVSNVTGGARAVYFWDIQKSNPETNADSYPRSFFSTVTAMLQQPVADVPGTPLLFSEATYSGLNVQQAEPPCLWDGELYSPVNGAGLVNWYHGFYSFRAVSGAARPALLPRLLMINPVAQQRRISGCYVGPGNKLYFSVRRVEATGLAAETYSWDGLELPTLIDTAPTAAGTKPRGVVGSLNDVIFVAYDDLPNIVRRIPLGGAGASMTMPSTVFKIGCTNSGGGTNSMGGYDCWATFKGAIYLAGRDATGAVIYTAAAGATVFTTARNPGTISVLGIKVFNGYLYYLYKTGAGPTLKLGRFDGTTWTDTYVTFAGTYPGDTGPSQFFIWQVPGNASLAFTSLNGPQHSEGPDALTWNFFGGALEFGQVASVLDA